MTIVLPGKLIEKDPQVVAIFFNTALYDQIERDKKGSMAIHQQSCEMSIILHSAKPSNQILPQDKRVNYHNLST